LQKQKNNEKNGISKLDANRTVRELGKEFECHVKHNYNETNIITSGSSEYELRGGVDNVLLMIANIFISIKERCLAIVGKKRHPIDLFV